MKSKIIYFLVISFFISYNLLSQNYMPRNDVSCIMSNSDFEQLMIQINNNKKRERLDVIKLVLQQQSCMLNYHQFKKLSHKVKYREHDDLHEYFLNDLIKKSTIDELIELIQGKIYGDEGLRFNSKIIVSDKYCVIKYSNYCFNIKDVSISRFFYTESYYPERTCVRTDGNVTEVNQTHDRLPSYNRYNYIEIKEKKKETSIKKNKNETDFVIEIEYDYSYKWESYIIAKSLEQLQKISKCDTQPFKTYNLDLKSK